MKGGGGGKNFLKDLVSISVDPFSKPQNSYNRTEPPCGSGRLMDRG